MTSQPDPFATLTDLFTTPAAVSDFPEAPVACEIEPRIECLLPGHLPVRAAVWFGPCAWALNADAGAAGLLRIEEDSIGLHCMADTVLPRPDREQALGAAIELMAARCRRWAVVPTADWDVVHLATAGFDRITILSGTDQAAVVAAYQLCKSFAALPDAVQLDLGVCFAGSTPSVAAETGSRLADTVHDQLGFEIAIRESLHHIDASAAQVQACRFPNHPHGIDGVVADLHRGLAAASAERPACAAVEPEPSPALLEDSVPEPMIDVPPPPLVVADELLQPLDLEPPIEQPDVEAEVDGDELTGHVPGLVALPVGCPACPEVELAVDTEGRVHCLGRTSALRQLQVASRWVTDHHELLALACPGLLSGSAQEPSCHLFTPHPPELADLHGSDLQLHLLTRVEVGSESTWYSCPLS
ncbi:MAG: hypothetical protein CMJ41_01600 [Phycisphaerae bacterium]|nr:hypothetical protein [Phycisphaerae bacterium]